MSYALKVTAKNTTVNRNGKSNCRFPFEDRKPRSILREKAMWVQYIIYKLR